MLADLHRRYGSNQIRSVSPLDSDARRSHAAQPEPSSKLRMRVCVSHLVIRKGYSTSVWCSLDQDEPARALALLRRTVDAGFSRPAGLDAEPSFRGLRVNPQFEALRVEAGQRHQRAAEAFGLAGGDTLLM